MTDIHFRGPRWWPACAVALLVAMALAVACGGGASTATPTPATNTTSRPVDQPALASLHMNDGGTGWAANAAPDGKLGVARTEDSGRTWRDVSPAIGPDYAITGTYFLDAARAWALTWNQRESHIWWTEDGARSWRQGPDLGAFGSGQMTFAPDGRQGWFAQYRDPANPGTALGIFRSADAGLTWRLVSATVPDDQAAAKEQAPSGCAKQITILDRARGFAAASCPGASPAFYRSNDGASTWQRVVLPLPPVAGAFVANCSCGVSGVAFPSGTDGFAVVSGTVRALIGTKDGGTNWSVLSYPEGAGELAVHFADAVHGWLYGARDLYATADGGRSWERVAQVFDGGPVSFSSATDVWAWLRLGWSGQGDPVLAYSKDGGRSWEPVR